MFVFMTMNYDLPFALHIHAREGHILDLLPCIVLITSVTEAVVSIHQSPGIAMGDREGSNEDLNVYKDMEFIIKVNAGNITDITNLLITITH